MVGTLLFLATLALVVTYDGDVRLDRKCQLASYKLRSAATKGTLKGGRHSVDRELASMGCLPETKAVLIREIEKGRAGKNKETGNAHKDSHDTRTISPVTNSKPSVLTDPTIKPQGTKTPANKVRDEAKKVFAAHSENVANENFNAKAARSEDEGKLLKKQEALRSSLAEAWEEFQAIIGDAPDAESKAYPTVEISSPWPELPENESDVANGNFNECGSCDECVAGFGGGRRRGLLEKDTYESISNSPSTYASRRRNTLDASSGLRCNQCTGCSTMLTPITYNTRFGPFRFANEKGATSASVFEASDVGESMAIGVSQTGILKTPCFAKRYPDGTKYAQKGCAPDDVPDSPHKVNLKQSEAIQKLAEACGAEDTSVRQWIATVKTSHPLSGEKFNGDVLFMEHAKGVSLERFTRGKPDFIAGKDGNEIKPPDAIRVVHDTINAVDSLKVIRAALLDFLTGQCDRHAQNVFITEDGDFKFIDNDQALGVGWRKCVANSVFVPGSDKFSIARWGNPHVNGNGAPNVDMNLQVLLDYRCHVPDGTIGGNFPHKFRQCVDWLSTANVSGTQQRFGFPTEEGAEFVIQRAVSLTQRGFEKALQKAQLESKKSTDDVNTSDKAHRVFLWPEPCCELSETRKEDKLTGYACSKQSKCAGGYDACETEREKEWFKHLEEIE